MSGISRWRRGAMPGCRWELGDPLFWPRWLGGLVVGSGFFLSLMFTGALWLASGLEAWFTSRAALEQALAQRREDRLALERLTLLRAQRAELAIYQRELNAAFAVPARPLEALSALAVERGLEITRLAPLGKGPGRLLELSLEGDFAPLVALMLAPSALGAVSLGDFELGAGPGQDNPAADVASLSLRLELGWHPEAAAEASR